MYSFGPAELLELFFVAGPLVLQVVKVVHKELHPFVRRFVFGIAKRYHLRAPFRSKPGFFGEAGRSTDRKKKISAKFSKQQMKLLMVPSPS